MNNPTSACMSNPVGINSLRSHSTVSKVFVDALGGKPLARRVARVPVPGPIAGAGLPGLILPSGGLLGWWRRRQKICLAV
jgi:hypothetical protein